MSFLPELFTRVKSFLAAVVGFFKDLAGKIAGEKARNAPGKLLERIPEAKRHLVIIFAGGGLALALLVFAGASLLAGKSEKANSAAESAVSRRLPIPPEEIFLPDEPDFIPGVILERERRTVWTAEDAAPYWQDPLKNGEEQWRERVEASIDELLERVP